jgi:putative transcriptional regulator
MNDRTVNLRPEHHPSPETLAAYVAGSLRPGFDLVVAAHLSGCAACGEDVRRLESMGGAVLSEIGPSALSADALARTLERIGAPQPPAAPRPSLNELLASARKRWVAPGVWVAKVDTPVEPGDRVYLLGAAKGAATARHGHHGAEFTQVLSGALGEGDVVYRAGDFCQNDETRVHRPSIVGDEECVCLFATQGRLAPTGIIGRIAFALADV